MRKNAAGLALLGMAMAYRDPRTGAIVVDTDSIEPADDRELGFGEDEYDDDDYIEGEYEDDFDDDLELGARRPRRRQRQDRRRRQRRQRQDLRRSQRRERQDERRGVGAVNDNADDDGWGVTVLSASETLGAAGASTLRIRLQHDFIAEDITFTGSLAASTVESIFFGDRPVFSNAQGVDVSVFAVGGFLRGLLKGQTLKAGLDIVIRGTLPGAGTLTAAITGKKPLSSC